MATIRDLRCHIPFNPQLLFLSGEVPIIVNEEVIGGIGVTGVPKG